MTAALSIAKVVVPSDITSVLIFQRYRFDVDNGRNYNAPTYTKIV